jgi:HNH endonuclease
MRVHGTVELTRPTVEQRFWAKVDKSGDCWLWTASVAHNGYGKFGVGYKVRSAHSFAYELTVGPVPPGMEIDHSCRVPSCVNPAHLRVVTRKQNLENMPATGRGKSGVRGVHWAQGFWLARVTHNRRNIYFGKFLTIEEAAEAARVGRLSLFTHNDADREGISA